MLSASLLFVSLGAIYYPLLILFLLPSLFLHKRFIYTILSKLESFKKKGNKLFNLKDLKLEQSKTINLQSSFPLKTFLIEMLFICSKFIGFIICFNIFNQNITQNIFILFIAFCLSWSIGLIIPAAPGGLGVFEASFIFLMNNDFAQGSIIESLIYFRFISTISDLLLSSPLFLRRFLKKS